MKKYKAMPSMVSNVPVCFCCSMVNALQSNILKDSNAMPLAMIIAATMPRKMILTSGMVYRMETTVKKPAKTILQCMMRLKPGLITA